MSIQTLSRCGAALFLAALASGCSSTGPAASDRKPASARVSDECKPNRSSCLHEGAYEPGERDYAEDEAKRLNLAEFERLRRVMAK